MADHAHAKGLKLIVWFEPERVTPGTWLYEQRPAWLLKLPPNTALPPSRRDSRLLNLGNPEAWHWVTNHGERYTITNFDEQGRKVLTGRELMEDGLLVSLRQQPDSAIIVYKRIRGTGIGE